jgi:glycopeptide antibiotics resistance protein
MGDTLSHDTDDAVDLVDPDDGRVLHRHPFLSLLTLAYLGFVGLVTLTPSSEQPDYYDLATRVLARLERYPELAPLTSRLNVDRVEFLANIGLFVPVGVFLLLLVGARLWPVALGLGVVLTSVIENVQRGIPGRVPDPRDVVANSLGTVVGVALALVLTLPATLRRRREARAR